MGTEVAIKRYLNKDEKCFKAFLVEVEINLAIKSHPNIILFLGAFQKDKYSYIINDLAKKGNLHTYF